MNCTFCNKRFERGEIVRLIAIDSIQFKDGDDGAFDEDELREFGLHHNFDRVLCDSCAEFPERIAFAAKQYLITSGVLAQRK